MKELLSLCNLFCCCGDQNTSVKLLTVSLFYFFTQCIYKATSRKKILIPIQALKPLELGRDWHYLLHRQSWS